MFGPFHVEDAKPTTVFNTIIGKMDTAASMVFYNSWFFKVRDLGYNLMPDFDNPSDLDLFRDVNLSFEVAKDVELYGRA